MALQQRSDKADTVLLEYGQGSKIKLPALHIAAKKDDVSAAKLLLKSESPDKESMVCVSRRANGGDKSYSLNIICVALLFLIGLNMYTDSIPRIL